MPPPNEPINFGKESISKFELFSKGLNFLFGKQSAESLIKS